MYGGILFHIIFLFHYLFEYEMLYSLGVKSIIGYECLFLQRIKYSVNLPQTLPSSLGTRTELNVKHD